MISNTAMAAITNNVCTDEVYPVAPGTKPELLGLRGVAIE